jgi:coenzyme F420-reducing hydrogenase gamma subunit
MTPVSASGRVGQPCKESPINATNLEKAAHPDSLRCIAVEPVSGIEGHGEVMMLVHDVVRIDYFLPGCPPSADTIWSFLSDIIAGRTPTLGHGLIHYD